MAYRGKGILFENEYEDLHHKALTEQRIRHFKILLEFLETRNEVKTSINFRKLIQM